MKRKSFAILSVLCVLLLCVFCFVACNGAKFDNGDMSGNGDVSDNGDVTDCVHNWIQATCQAPKTCSLCGATDGGKDVTAHIFNQRIMSARYIVSKGDCETCPVYNLSCVCGAVGTDTFEGSSFSDHAWGEWKSENNGSHVRYCMVNSKHSETRACVGGTATCIDKAVCELCGEEYGSLGKHVYNQKIIDDNYLIAEATCQTPAKYYYSCICGEHGSLYFYASGVYAPHDWSEWMTLKDGRHYRYCINEYHIEYEDCHGGNATCANKAICEVCNSEYGEKSQKHTGKVRVEEDKYLVDDVFDCTTHPTYYYTCLCGESISADTYEGNLILRHSVVEDEYVPAYFGASGLTQGYHC
ncbi:MAG: hypothetical protein HDT36_01155, partial [Clostridiales bacterium]|nr:hypothetical protein [Clostridiales bacterium]